MDIRKFFSSKGQHVMKKWTNMKDNWMKCHKKMGEYKSGAGAHKIRKYNFYDQMLFLSKIVEHRKTDSSMDEHVNSSGINNENAEPNPSRSQNGKASEAPKAKQKKKNNQLSEVDIKFMKFMDVTAQEEKSRSMNFFRGISDSVDKFTDENMIDFQFQVISIIKSIQERENNRYIAAPRNQWDHGQQGYQSGTTPANSQFSVYGHSTAARSGFGINGQEYDFGHSSGLEPIPNRPESQASAQSANTESTSANSQASTEGFMARTSIVCRRKVSTELTWIHSTGTFAVPRASLHVFVTVRQKKRVVNKRPKFTSSTEYINQASDIQIKTLKERIVVLEKQNKAFTERVEKIEEKTALKYKDVLAKVFTLGQIKKLLNAGKKRVRWSPEDIATAISLRSVSPKAYRYLRVNNYPLPALSTLRSWVSSFDVHQGILKSVITLMQKKSLDCTEADRICVLSFDEMYVSNKIEIDKKTEQIIGPHRCCQTVMVRGLLSKWKQPIYYEFDQSMMKYIIEKIVAELFRANFIVVAITSDMGTGNTGLWSQLEEVGCSKGPQCEEEQIIQNTFVEALYLEDHVIDEDMLKLVDNYEVKEKIHHDSLKYVAGFVAYKFKHKYNLGNPTNTFERNIEPDWLQTISRGSLLYPNDELYEATLKLESTTLLYKKNKPDSPPEKEQIAVISPPRPTTSLNILDLRPNIKLEPELPVPARFEISLAKGCDNVSATESLDDGTLFELRQKIERIDAANEEFAGIQCQIESLVLDDDLDEQIAEREVVENYIDRYLGLAKSIINDKSEVKSGNSAKSIPSTASSARARGEGIVQIDVRLPKIELPKYSGDANSWVEFREIYNSLGHCPSTLKTFVANRLSEIQTLTAEHQWRYIETKHNPADVLSRGAYPHELSDMVLWWNGPDFLSEDESNWPDVKFSVPNLPEMSRGLKILEMLNLDVPMAAILSENNTNVVGNEIAFESSSPSTKSGHDTTLNLRHF
ncbi:unnamed protein product [Acanthoscelides obtectus]|uniref:Transposase n=1 Tax=Acanthoscelides obtectus TaxID=200917 RepID=A0A9P0KWF2_ACAOB|nr:unnamed protein product [Acanthoscelides obtectus]CAK1670236.1 Transposable element P transposase [Acanthoscelides obtectus]